MSDEQPGTRRYRKRRRAEQEAATRQRITESAVELHGTIGPSQTTMAALAAHAAVQRSTLYRHFPDESAVFDACIAHWSAANPLPDPGAWAAEADPVARLRAALEAFYGFYGRTERMLANLYRDRETHAITAERFGDFDGYLDGVRDRLAEGFADRGRRRARRRAAIGHALAFSTWRSLVREQGLTADEAVDLVASLVRGG